MTSTTSHIVTIARAGAITGFQLRVNGGGAGNTKFFAAKKHGGAAKARRAAEQMMRTLGLPKPQSRGGSDQGRVTKSSTTGAAGIRCHWTAGELAPVLRVIASWTDKRGKARNTSYSVERNGLDGALDKAIQARTSAGAPPVDRAALLKALRRVHRAGVD